MGYLYRVWNGELSLEKVFWEWAVAGGLAVNLLSSALFLVLMLNDQLILAIIVGYGFSIPYNLLVAVGVWRSAEQYPGEKQWAELAKLVTVIGMILLSVT